MWSVKLNFPSPQHDEEAPEGLNHLWSEDPIITTSRHWGAAFQVNMDGTYVPVDGNDDLQEDEPSNNDTTETEHREYELRRRAPSVGVSEPEDSINAPSKDARRVKRPRTTRGTEPRHPDMSTEASPALAIGGQGTPEGRAPHHRPVPTR